VKKLAKYFSDESGASSAEYALILALIAAALIGSSESVASSINNVDLNVTHALNNAVTAS